jgi:betaine-aldehyde dehydrogenase
MLIGGSAHSSISGNVISIENPATYEPAGSIPRAESADVDRAVDDSARAFAEWRRVPARERGLALMRMADALEPMIGEIARLMTLETGAAIRTQSRPEATRASEVIRYFGGVAPELKGTTIPLGEGLLSYTRREPLGVVAGIVPWNAPLILSALKIGSALATGNTLVLKPSHEASLAVIRMAEICQAHLPPGVLNVVTGYGGEAGATLAAHPRVAHISFTGSTEIGKDMIRTASSRIGHVSLELGGKNPTIVFPDSDDDDTASGVINGMRLTRQGQSCSAGTRLLVHSSIVDSFLAKVAAKIGMLRIGDPLDESTDVGTLINRDHFERVSAYVSDGISQGASVEVGGVQDREGLPKVGYFMRPTLLSGVRSDWRVTREEIFGPVAVVIPWDDEDEAIRQANDTHYGLTAFVWCKEIGRALRAAHAVEAGWVQVNRGLGQLPGMSYGGTKESGWGREFSLDGAAESLTQVKNVTVSL